VISEAGHCPHDEAPDPVNRALLQALQLLLQAQDAT